MKIIRLLKSAIARQSFFALWVLVELSVVQIEIIDFTLRLRTEPFNALAILPKAMFDSVLFLDRVDTKAVLLSVEPIPCVLSIVLPLIDSVTMFLVILVFTMVYSAIFPAVDAKALHVVLAPFPLVGSAVEPFVNA